MSEPTLQMRELHLQSMSLRSEIVTMIFLTEQEQDEAVSSMLGEMDRGGVNLKRLTVRILANWCLRQEDVVTEPRVKENPEAVIEELQKLSKEDSELKQECGSIFILLLGNLAIQLFILWLKRRLDR